jgi:hypothetical protein
MMMAFMIKKVKLQATLRVKLAVMLVLCMSLVLPTYTVLAVDGIGTVTINGETVRPILFEGFSEHYMSKSSRCPPTSDARIRDLVIGAALVVFDGRKKGFEIPERSQRRIAKFRQELELAGPDGNPLVISAAEIEMFNSEYGAYIDQYPIVVTHEQILEEYKRLIKVRDPRFTDVKLIRRTPIEMHSSEEATKARRLLENGATIADIEDMFDYVYVAKGYAAQWNIAYKVIDNYRQYENEYVTGAIVRVDDLNLLKINEVKIRSRLRPFAEYENTKEYVYKEIERDLREVRRRERDKALWAAAEVLEDGEPVELADHYPQCNG